MDWDSEARELLARAPICARPLARRKIEEFARARGADRVTGAVARQAYDAFRGQAGGALEADAADRMPPAALIERLESEAEALANGDGFRTRHYRVRPCAGAVGCPRSLIPVRETAEALAQAIADSGFPAFLDQGLAGRPMLSHHRFQAAVAGCPNACSQPQIQDFGVIGVAAIEISAELCDGCLRCVKACREQAVAVSERTPVIDRARCIGCGDCVRACPSQALTLGARSYQTMAGGKLGRHPRLADQVAATSALTEVVGLLDRALNAMMERGQPGERLAALLAQGRAGVARLLHQEPGVHTKEVADG